ncbi:SRPBCC family protein [cf. Phormidesmis sp. LEGE 11477]|nr:SRPBCC family protein [cf. Phormidesmis sp. LEGE 11477]
MSSPSAVYKVTYTEEFEGFLRLVAIMSSRHTPRRARSLGKLAAIALTLITPLATTASAQSQLSLTEESSQSVFDALSGQERAALEAGQVMVSAARNGDNGQFTARVLIDAPVEQAWEVLTDYDNFEKFLPNIENSELLESEDNRRVFEQMNVISVVPSVLEINSRVVIESTENYPKVVDFRLVDGDLDALQGIWQLDPVTTDDSGTEQVLVTHQVNIDPGNSSPRGLFFSTYRLVLEDSLLAAKAETEKRAKAVAAE